MSRFTKTALVALCFVLAITVATFGVAVWTLATGSWLTLYYLFLLGIDCLSSYSLYRTFKRSRAVDQMWNKLDLPHQKVYN